MSEEAGALGVQGIAYAGLDALLHAAPFDLCAYLHVAQEAGPQLYLRRPTLTDLDPNDAFRLFTAIRDTLEHPVTDGERRRIDAFDAVVVVSSSGGSRGLWVAGREVGALTDGDASVAEAMGRAVMGVCHAAETAASGTSPTTVVRVTIESSDDRVHAEVAVDEGGHPRVGRGEAMTALGAVASAALEAVDPSLKLVAAEEDAISESRAVLVLVRDALGRPSLGASLIGIDPLRATAAAAVNAASAARVAPA